jgi:hypothetical protein
MAPVGDPLEAEALTKVAHKFNVRSALAYCDAFLAAKAEEPHFFILGVRARGQAGGACCMLEGPHMQNS